MEFCLMISTGEKEDCACLCVLPKCVQPTNLYFIQEMIPSESPLMFDIFVYKTNSHINSVCVIYVSKYYDELAASFCSVRL